MKQLNSSSPIGIFDSGIGGLTVAQAVSELLPYENIIYFGDTAHLPYGDKSTSAIQAYSIKICDMLLQQSCKTILIACHSASAAAFDLVKEYVGNKAKIINVIDPVIDHLREYYPSKQIGLIGTRQTVNSNVYKKKIDNLNLGIQLHSLATPLLVPLIEEGFASNTVISTILADYLNHPDLSQIDALLLGCTHYPLIKKHIASYYQHRVHLIDSADITASALKGLLEFHQLINRENQPSRKFYISDYTESFVNSAKLFFAEATDIQHYPLWD
jgi:glutamate racemase